LAKEPTATHKVVSAGRASQQARRRRRMSLLVIVQEQLTHPWSSRGRRRLGGALSRGRLEVSRLVRRDQRARSGAAPRLCSGCSGRLGLRPAHRPAPETVVAWDNWLTGASRLPAMRPTSAPSAQTWPRRSGRVVHRPRSTPCAIGAQCVGARSAASSTPSTREGPLVAADLGRGSAAAPLRR
jgi:hypothetical protein